MHTFHYTSNYKLLMPLTLSIYKSCAYTYTQSHIHTLMHSAYTYRERLRKIRAACPNILLQCLVRGANGVGYTSYADNVVEEFVVLAAKNGMDVFRIFDCFNIVDNMRVCIDAVKKTGKVAEVG